MYTRLKRYILPMVVALALCTAIVVAWPAPAQAQTSPADGTRGAESGLTRVVVEPGDSLWSISQSQLPADATPQQIYNETARIYALNNERVGEDPGLIYPGQVLLVAPKAASAERGSVVQQRRPGASAREVSSASSEGTLNKAATAEEPSREIRQTSQGRSLTLTRAARREPSAGAAARQRPLPALARAPVPEPVAGLSSEAASAGDEASRLMPQGRLLTAAVVGMATGGGVLCLLALAVVFVAGRLRPPKEKHAARYGHGRSEKPPQRVRHEKHWQRSPNSPPPAPEPSASKRGRPQQDQPQALRPSPRTLKTHAKKGVVRYDSDR